MIYKFLTEHLNGHDMEIVGVMLLWLVIVGIIAFCIAGAIKIYKLHAPMWVREALFSFTLAGVVSLIAIIV